MGLTREHMGEGGVLICSRLTVVVCVGGGRGEGDGVVCWWWGREV